MRRFDVVVVGAGPAGLSVAAELARDHRCLLLDRGPLAGARDRHAPADVLSGVGGAGLFSDGKHSFYPSATALWQLPDREALDGAFEATAALLRAHGVETAASPHAAPTTLESPAGWHAKPYPSRYVPFAERLAIIDELWSACPDRWPEARLVEAERGEPLRLRVERRDGHLEDILTRDLVIATGRWSPRPLRPLLETLGVSYAFRRDEIGVRIETPAEHPVFARLPGVDGKLVLRDGELELRTFCTCRDGEVVLGHADGLRAFSGRADGPATGRSNLGLVVRGALGDAVDRAATATPLRIELADWLAGGPAVLGPVFGELGATALWRAMERLRAWAPELTAATIFAPVIEGVGAYPIDDALALAPHVWIAGDACGRFRGIVASMVSGRYVARRIRANDR